MDLHRLRPPRSSDSRDDLPQVLYARLIPASRRLYQAVVERRIAHGQ
jgi:hypothetical protein